MVSSNNPALTHRIADQKRLTKTPPTMSAPFSALPLSPARRLSAIGSRVLWLFAALALLLGLWPSHIHAQPTALQPNISVDRNDIALGETFRVTVSQRVKGNNFNVSAPSHQPLQKDFNVMGINSNNRMESGAGGVSGVLEWTYTLQARAAGLKTIPALRVGNASTESLPINILPKRQYQQAKRTFATVTLSTESPYVQGQMLYTVRVYMRSGLGVADWQLGAPTADAVVVPVSQQAVFRTRIGNRDYDVIEQRWALFMQQSGSQTITGPRFIAEISDGGFFSRRSQEAIEVPDQTVNVLAPAANFAGPLWLPATGLEVNGRIVEQSEGKPLKAGEPFTYEIGITASGLTAAQLPEPQEISAANSRSYPEPTENRQAIDGNGITGQRLRRIAIVPDAAGQLTLPRQEVSWWDVTSNSQKTAVLPARKIIIETDPNAKAEQPQTAPTPNTVNPLPSAENLSNGGVSANHWTQHKGWFYAALLLLAAWLTTLFLLIKQKASKPQQREVMAKPATESTASQALQTLLSHCRSEDGKAAAAAAKKWSQLQWPNARTHDLQACAQRLGHDGVSRHFADLDASLYSGSANSWDGKATATALQIAIKTAGHRKSSSSADDSMLPGLYKTATK